MQNGKLILKFNEQETFGNFCSGLHEEGVPFDLLGNQTISIPGIKKACELPHKAQTWFEALKKEELAEEVLPLARTGRRKLPTTEEAKKIMRERALKYV